MYMQIFFKSCLQNVVLGHMHVCLCRPSDLEYWHNLHHLEISKIRKLSHPFVLYFSRDIVAAWNVKMSDNFTIESIPGPVCLNLKFSSPNDPPYTLVSPVPSPWNSNRPMVQIRRYYSSIPHNFILIIQPNPLTWVLKTFVTMRLFNKKSCQLHNCCMM